MIDILVHKRFHRPTKKNSPKRPDFILDFEAKIPSQSFTGLIGPSGCGKTTLLRCLAGIEKFQKGRISVNDKLWHDSHRGFDLPAHKRSIGMVFQDYALFPHLTVLGNLLFARNDKFLAEKWLGMVGLESESYNFPRELSGGQRQRVALVRALMREPELVLMDEALSAIQEDLREQLGDQLKAIQKEKGFSLIMVSHSKQELERLCDQIIVMEPVDLQS